MATYNFPPLPLRDPVQVRALAKLHGGEVKVEKELFFFIKRMTITLPDAVRENFERDLDDLIREWNWQTAIR